MLGTHRSLYLSRSRRNAVSLCDQDTGIQENSARSETHDHVEPSVYQQLRGNQILIFTPWAQFRTTLLKKASNSMFLDTEIRCQRGRGGACCSCPSSSALHLRLHLEPTPLGSQPLRSSSHRHDLGVWSKAHIKNSSLKGFWKQKSP